MDNNGTEAVRVPIIVRENNSGGVEGGKGTEVQGSATDVTVVFGYTDRHPRGFVFGGLPHFPPEFLEVLFCFLFLVFVHGFI